MTAKLKLTFIISALAVFAVFLSITVFSYEGPSCAVSGTCSALSTDSSGSLFVKSANTPIFIIATNGVVTMASSSPFTNAGLVFPDGTKQTTAFTGSASNPVTIAGNVGSGDFGSNTGGGNYSFPASVGIGTTTPLSALHVNSSAQTVNSGIVISNSNSPSNIWKIWEGTPGNYDGYLKFALNPTTQNDWDMVMDTSGNLIVPYGISTPYFRSTVMGLGDIAVLQWVGTGSNYNGTVRVGMEHPYGNHGVDVTISSPSGSTGNVSGTAFRIINQDQTQEYFRVNNLGYVGIGTTDPQYPLEVLGTSNKLGISYAYTTSYGSTGGELSADSDGNLHIIATKRFPTTSVRNILLAENTGKVGIATTTPTYPLTVAGTIHSSTGGYRFPDGTTQTTAATAGTSYFTLSGSNLYPTSTAYNVGVGTSSPAYKLDVSTGASTVYPLQLTSSGKFIRIGALNSTYAHLDTDATSGFYFYDAVNAGGGNNLLNISTGDSYLASAGGNVGIGTASAPGAKLEVAGTIKITGGTPGAGKVLTSDAAGLASWTTPAASGGGYGWTTSGTNVILATSSNYVGIGTSTPAGKFTISNNVGSDYLDNFSEYQILLHNGSTALMSYGLGIKANTMVFNSGAGAYSFDRSGNANTMTLTTAGNVGIATTTPTYPLTVAGVIHSSTGGFRFPDSTTQTSAGATYAGTGTFTGVNYFQNTAGSGVYLRNAGGSNLQSYSSDGGATYMSFHRAGVYAVNFGLDPDGSIAIGGWSDGAVNRIKIETTGNTTFGSTGTAKISVGTVDPPYTINGEQYATYIPGMIGQKEETTGEVEIVCDTKGVCEKAIDFGKEVKGRDLWLFAKTTDLKNNFAKMTVLLTPSFDGKVWYEKDAKNNILKIFASPSSAFNIQNSTFLVSYRLTAPRFDSAKWLNTRNDAGVDGFIIND